MTCTNCGHEAKHFFTIKLPVYPFSVSKEIKSNMPEELSNMITLNYHTCFECGYIFSNITKEDFELLQLIYKKYYNYMNKTNVINYDIQSLLDTLSPFLRQGRSLIEIGCYDGSFLSSIHQQYPHLNLMGIEPSEIGVKGTKEKGFNVINDFFPTKEKVEPVDVIVSSHVIEHVPDIFSFLNGQAELLNPEGVILFETPNVDWAVKNSSSKPFHFQHLILLSKKYIKSLLLSLGITHVNIYEIDWRIIVACSKHPHAELLPINTFDFKENEIETYLPKFQQNVSQHQERFSSLFDNSNEEFWIWGASSFCGNIIANLEQKSLQKIKGIIDSDAGKEYNEFLFAPFSVTSPNKINEKNIKNIIIMSTYENEILDYILTLNINHDMIIYTLYTGLCTYRYNASGNTITKTLS